MREIKFRAWDNVLKEHLPNVQNHINGEWAFGNMLKNERWIIEQYTGLKDKNGKEIYEGDIITFLDSVGKIIYFESYASFVISYGDNFNDLHNITTQEEVIGNVHENR